MRALLNLKQSELAEQAGLPRRDIIQFEKDRALPTKESQKAIEAVFKITLDAPHIEEAFRVLSGVEHAHPDPNKLE
jgi:transcriptional regulator with XRE-family HTH domain